MFSRKFCRSLIAGLVLCLVVVVSSGCDFTRNTMRTDRAANLDMQDYRDALAERTPELPPSATREGDGIPDFQSYVARPSENLRSMPLVSIAVNQTIPLRDALYELAGQAGYDIELDPRITGSIIFTAKEKPFDLVVRRISEIAGLRYKITEDILRVELDTPYLHTYKLDYLSYIRRNSSSIQNSVSVVSGEGADTGSSFSAQGESEANFWGELDTGLQQILGVSSQGGLRTQTDPQITAAPPNPAPVEPVAPGQASPPASVPSDPTQQGGQPTPTEGGGQPPTGSTAENGTPPAAPGEQPPVQVQPPNAVLQVAPLPLDDIAGGGGTGTEEEPESGFSLNKQAGMISIFATERQHEKVREYLTELKRAVTSQVLIEAKVLEVDLTDEFSTGIDWNILKRTNVLVGDISFGLSSDGTPGGALFDPAQASANKFTASFSATDIDGAIEAISRFGVVRALSSPRLTVLNNQSAVLNVASNQVYFEIEITTEEGSDGEPDRTTVESDIKNVPEGLLINVQPSIDLDNRMVSMAVRPTITRITDFVDDPSVQFVTAQAGIEGVQSRIPIVNVQEMDSVIRMNSGQAVVMGGLMQDRTATDEVGVPVLSEVPLFGSLFKTHSDSIQKTELVIFLKATIIEGGDNIHPTDTDIYKTFGTDRRPFRM